MTGSYCVLTHLTHLSFYDHLSSVSFIVCNLFTSSSSSTPQCNFNKTWNKAFLGEGDSKFKWREGTRSLVRGYNNEMKSHTHFQGKVIKKKQKYTDESSNPSPEPPAHFQPNLAQSTLEWWESMSVQKGPYLFPNGDSNEIAR